MNCRQYRELLFEHAEQSLSRDKCLAAERHLATCFACRELERNHREWALLLTRGFLRESEGIIFNAEAQRRVVAALQQPRPGKAHGTNLLLDWWRHIAWAGAVATILVVTLLFLKGFSSRDRQPLSLSSGNPPSVAPVVIRSSYCAPVYTFRREDDFVTDSLGCNPRIVEQTLWIARKQMPAATTSGFDSRL